MGSGSLKVDNVSALLVVDTVDRFGLVAVGIFSHLFALRFCKDKWVSDVWPCASLDTSDSSIVWFECVIVPGYFPFGSLNPLVLSATDAGTPGNEPIMTGCCFSIASRKNPTTQVPSVKKLGEFPSPCIDGSVTGIMTCAHGKSFDGISIKSSVW